MNDQQIDTVVNLNGLWSAGDRENARIRVIHDNALNVSMRAFGRPAAQGSILNANTITVTFPDDKTYTGTLQRPDRILWSNRTVWRRVGDVEG